MLSKFNKKFCFIIWVTFSLYTSAQNGDGIGFKGGINFASSGEFRTSFFTGANDFVLSSGTNLEFGYHIGVFGKLTLNNKFYFRPELVFTKRQNQYSITGSSEEENLNITSIDIPLLIGVKIVNPLSFFIGPSIHYMLDQNIESRGNFDNLDVENNVNFGINIGVAIAIKNFGIDSRYERSFGENLLSFQSNEISSFFGTIDTKFQQVILGLSYKLY